MFFNVLKKSLSYLDKLKWSGVVLANHESFWNGLLLRKERVVEHYNFIYLTTSRVKEFRS